MCGRITTVQWDELLAVLSCIETETPFNAFPDWPAQKTPRSDAYPNSIVPLIASNRISESEATEKYEATEKVWGYEPYSGNNVIFNTRIESADTSNLWKHSYKDRHCVIPVHAFYEPHRVERVERGNGKSVKQVYRFTDDSSPVMLLCGIWKEDRFSIMTMPPNAAVEAVHPRMPVLLTQEDAKDWLEYKGLTPFSNEALVLKPLYTFSKEEQERHEQGRLF